jgi:hypothetical protein
LALNEQKYGLIGLLIGAFTVIIGAVLIFVHSSGAVSLKIDVGGNDVHIETAVIGVVVAACGILIIALTRPKITIKRAKINAK